MSTINKAKISVMMLNLLVIILLSFVFINLVTIPLVSPENGLYTTERRPEFVWGGMQKDFVILVDDDPDFGTPVKAKISGNSYRSGDALDFGTYYWKVESGGISSGIRKFTLGSSVTLSRKESEVRNEGNVNIVVHRITGAFLLGVDESMETGREENVTAEQA